MKDLTAHVELINEQINSLELTKKPANLYEPMSYILGLAGKRMRPALAMMSTELFGADPKISIHQALAVEIFHNFTLVHDDIMDKAPLRRGKPTVHKKWNEHIGILSGDALMIAAYQELVKADAEQVPSLMNVFNQTALEVCEGQQMDMDFETSSDITIDAYLEMISKKTAVLLGCSLQLGAIRAMASIEEQKLIYDFGKYMGIAFQLQDDYLDAFGDPEKVGKQIGGDIRANKKTVLYLKALEKSDERGKERLIELFETEDQSDAKVRAVFELFEQTDVRTETELLKQRYAKLGFDALDTINASNDSALRSFAQQLLGREH